MKSAKDTVEVAGIRSTSRRRFVSQGLCVAGAAIGPWNIKKIFASNSDTEGAATFPTVPTRYGVLRGCQQSGVRAFKGVPYGAPTGGANRFMPPLRPAHWKGVRDALDFGSPCPQVNNYVEFWQDARPQSEDCLVLNVFSPTTASSPDSLLPVMVWLHGGGFTTESAGSPAYDGFNLAKVGEVVVVSINHRLNVFGYLYLGQHADERFAVSGNVGQLDIVAALEWVRDNIENFGGDPHNVTIFGESGGGGKVSTIIATPAAQGLYHKAIVQSGSFLKVAEPAEATAMADLIYEQLGIKPGNVAALQRLPTERLVAAYQKVGAPVRRISYLPVLDGIVMPAQPWISHAPEQAARIPMMIGTTQQEAADFCGDLLTKPMRDDRELLAAVTQGAVLSYVPAEKYPDLIKLYRQLRPDLQNPELAVRIATDLGMWRNALLQATRKLEAGGPPVFMYQFGWKTPCYGGSWSLHAIDIPFVFGHEDYLRAWDQNDSPAVRAAADPLGDRYRLAQLTMKTWAAFARAGDPSTPGLKWPAYNLNSRATMFLDRSPHLVNDPQSEARKVLMAIETRAFLARVRI